MKKLTQDEFVARATKRHNGFYSFEKAVYVNNSTKVCVLCPIHGEFWIEPRSLFVGCGCYQCGRFKTTIGNKVPKKRARKIHGVGINDYDGVITTLKPYYIWINMLDRCYGRVPKKFHSYEGCSVCDEWKYFSNFKRWFDDPENGYRDGYCLDKDILVKNNKVYSPKTCCFVPSQINVQIKSNRKSKMITGVVKSGNKFRANVTKYGKSKLIGKFDTQEEAFAVFKKHREAYIKEIAKKYYEENKITKKVYNALMIYEVKLAV